MEIIDFVVNNINILEDCSVLGTKFNNLLQEVFTMIKIAVPCIVFALCVMDMAKAVIAQDDKAVKEAQSRSIKRVIVGVVLFFVPMFINILLDFAANISGTCGIS